MTAPGVVGRGSRLRPAVLLLGFATAVALRAAVSGSDGVHSPAGGLLFAVLLLAAVLGARTVVPLSRRAVSLGLLGAGVLCLPVLLSWSPRLVPTDGFATWALVVSVVAVAEEVFLRGTLYDAVRARSGENAAIAVGAVAFALLHVPLYGWYVVPLDLAVGVLLGEQRRVTGTPAAPAITHVGADLASWFLR